MRLERRSRFF